MGRGGSQYFEADKIFAFTIRCGAFKKCLNRMRVLHICLDMCCSTFLFVIVFDFKKNMWNASHLLLCDPSQNATSNVK